MADDAVPVDPTARRRFKSRGLIAHTPDEDGEDSGSSFVCANPAQTSLTELCRLVICANLELYPPEVMSMFDEHEWMAIIKLRHERTSPKHGHGGLDGKGRMTPAVSAKFLRSVEEVNEVFRSNQLVDQLVWKDCVEYKFRRGGLTRPRAFLLPWNILVQSLQEAAHGLGKPPENFKPSDVVPCWCCSVQVKANAKTLVESPMNVALMKESGVGKIVSKFVKKHGRETCNVQNLVELLETWKLLAANSGVVEMDQDAKQAAVAGKRKKPPPSSLGNSGSPGQQQPDEDEMENLETLQECCHSWRELFAVLDERQEVIRSNQGKRMREIRRNLASDRPKVVKVHRSNPKRDRILDRKLGGSSSWGAASGSASKISKIKQEASIQSTRQKMTPTNALKASTDSSFGAAVAFASATSAKRQKHGNKVTSGIGMQRLAGGKKISVPTKVVQGAAAPRQMASKWKLIKKK